MIGRHLSSQRLKTIQRVATWCAQSTINHAITTATNQTSANFTSIRLSKRTFVQKAANITSPTTPTLSCLTLHHGKRKQITFNRSSLQSPTLRHNHFNSFSQYGQYPSQLPPPPLPPHGSYNYPPQLPPQQDYRYQYQYQMPPPPQPPPQYDEDPYEHFNQFHNNKIKRTVKTNLILFSAVMFLSYFTCQIESKIFDRFITDNDSRDVMINLAGSWDTALVILKENRELCEQVLGPPETVHYPTTNFHAKITKNMLFLSLMWLEGNMRKFALSYFEGVVTARFLVVGEKGIAMLKVVMRTDKRANKLRIVEISLRDPSNYIKTQPDEEPKLNNSHADIAGKTVFTQNKVYLFSDTPDFDMITSFIQYQNHTTFYSQFTHLKKHPSAEQAEQFIQQRDQARA